MKTTRLVRWPGLLAVAGCLLLCSSALADYQSEVQSDSPTGFWRLGDLSDGQVPSIAAGDVVGNSGTAGSALNGYYLYDTPHPVPGALAGSADGAAAFDGLKHRIDVPYSDLANQLTFSVELWVKITNFTIRALSPISSRDTNAQRGYVIYAFNGNTNWQFRTYNGATGYTVTSTNGIMVNEWTHLVGTYDGTQTRLFINGVEANAPITNVFTPNTAAPLRLGGGNNYALGGDYLWPGSIDEVAVYTNALSEAQILEHYQNGTNAARSTPYETLVQGGFPSAYWRLNDPTYAGTTSPTGVSNSGSVGAAANGVMISVPNSGVLGPYTTNGILGGVQGGLVGDANTALAFTASDGHVDVPYNPSLNGPQFSVEAWAYIPALYRDYQAIVSSRDNSSVGGQLSGYILYARNNNSWQFWTGTGSAWTTTVAGNTGSVTNGQWNHLVGVFDGTNQYFYVNGALSAFSANVTFLANGARPLRIGAGANEDSGGNYFLGGAVDEVAVYNQVIGQDRILAHYQAAQGSLPPATIAPSFAVNPANTTNHSLQTITLFAGALGSLPLTLQWYYVSPDYTVTNLIANATNNSLTLSPTAVADTGWYFVRAVNPVSTVDSSMAFVEIFPPQVPTIAEFPATVPVYVGGDTRIPTLVDGTPPITYQWRSNTVTLAGETNSSLLIPAVQYAYSNTAYSVSLTNPVGDTTSGNSFLEVLTAPSSTYAAVMTGLGPLAYWRLGEDAGQFAFDYWRGNHGLYQNCFPNFLPGALLDDDDGACAFYGSGSRVVVPNVTFNFTGTNAFTLSVWANPSALTGVQRLISNRQTGPNGGFGLGFRDSSRIRMTAFGVADVDSSVGTFVVNQWYHIAVVRVNNTVQFYVDGALRNTGTLNNINPSSNPLQLGGNPTLTEWFNGYMDDPAIFDRALSAAEVAALYAARSGALLPPTIVQEPSPNRIYAGGTARFRVEATGSQPLYHYWRANGSPIAGATNAELALANVTPAMSGTSYSVLVSNAASTALSVSVSLTVLTPYGYQAEVALDNPVAHWRLDEQFGPTVYDERGGFNGEAFSSIVFGQPGAVANDSATSFGFDGATTKVEVPYSPALNPPVFSVECWARVTGGAGSYRAAISARDFQQGYIIYAGNNNVWQFWTRAPGAAWQNLQSIPVVEGEWAHLVGTFDGTNKSIFVNGVLAATQVNTNYAPNFIRNLRIGQGNNEDDPGPGTFYNFPGDIDEVAIYDYALSAERVAVHYGLGKYSTDTAPLIVREPVPQTVGAGSPVTISAVAGGSPLLSYQWWKDGVPVAGATQPSLLFASAAYGDNGMYSLAVTNSIGYTNSATVRLAVMPPPAFALVTNDLVLHLKFESNYSDSSGRANDGNPMGFPIFVAGKIGANALHYNTDVGAGAYNYVTLGLPTDLLFSSNVNFSVAYWTKFAGAPGDLPFLCNAVNSYGGFGFTFAPSYNNGGWSWSLGNGTGSVGVYGAANSINDGNWHHLVHTFDRSGNAITYLDGLQVDSRPVAAAGDIDSYAVVNIGQDPTGVYAETGSADLDDLGIWRRVLTPYEALSIYTAGQQSGASFDTVLPIQVVVQPAGNDIELIWQDGILLQANDVTGPYEVVAGASAPYYKVTPSLARKFYKVGAAP